MRFLRLVALASFLISCSLQAQTKLRTREVSLTNENDVYLFQNIDRYYSNGIFLNYRFVPNVYLNDSVQRKRIFDIGIAQKFWTPQNLTLADPEDYDRPYAGMLNVSLRMADFRNDKSRLSYGLDFGVIGKASGAQAFQEWYHKVFGFPQPLGWEYQVPNTLILDLKFEYDHQFELVPGKLDLISSTAASLGTGFTHAIQRIDLRTGKLRKLSESAFFNALIGPGSKDIAVHHYFFLGYGIQYVGHDTTIQSKVSNDSEQYPYAENILSWVRHIRIGFATSSSKSTFKITYNWLSREVDQWAAGRHAYIGLELALRLEARN